MSIPINETLLTNFPPTTKTGEQQLVQYIKDAPFQDGHWKVLKGLYKKLEENPISEALIELIFKLDNTSQKELEHKYPTERSLGYMKRRAARYLRTISASNPDLYIEIVMGLLHMQKNEIDLDHQWVLGNILLGSSKRLVHASNGRGKMRIAESDLDICRREEKCPEIWDQNLFHLQNLLQSDELATLVCAFAIKVLIRNKKPLPTFSNQQLARFFQSDSPWLKQVAADQCYQKLLSGKLISSQFLAQSFFYSPADRRAWYVNVFFGHNENSDKPSMLKMLTNWLLPVNQKALIPSMKDLMKHIAELTFDHLKFPISGRVKSAAKVLLKHKQYVDTRLLSKHFKAILAAENNDLLELALDGASKSNYNQIKDWLLGAEEAPESIISHLFEVFEKKITINRSSVKLMTSFLYEHSVNLSHFGWMIISKSKKASNITQNFWVNQYWRGHLNVAFKNMASSKHGSELVAKFCQDRLRWIGWHYETVIYLINNAQSPLKESVYGMMKEKVQQDLQNWLEYLVKLEDDRDKIMNDVWPNITGGQISNHHMLNLLMNNHKWINSWAWRLLEEKKADRKCVYYISSRIIKDYQASKVLEFGTKMLEHSNKSFSKWFIEAVKDQVESNPHRLEKMMAFSHLFINELGPKSIQKLVEELPSAKWKKVRLSIHLYTMGENGSAFWKNVLNKIATGNAPKLYNRTLDDDLFLQSFYLVEDTSLLEEKSPVFGDLLFNWLQKQENLFSKGSTLLLAACKHPIIQIRNWAKQQVHKVGMDLIFALQLMESGVPDAFKLGKSFFEAAKDDSIEELEYVLALCDSPQKEVRDYGIKYMKERSANLKSSIAMACLSEHGDPIIQEFVAKQLKEQATKEEFVRTFDKGVLRTKNQSRKAKQIIKQRLEENLDVDAETLVELARGKNKKDAEWAVLQLTKLALSGQETAAFELD